MRSEPVVQSITKVKEDTDIVVLLAIRMPEMDGFETIRALREWESAKSRESVPVIFLTGHEDSDSEAKGLSLGAMDFIRKPFSSEALKIRMRDSRASCLR
ncbi:MAG: response regulator [Lachnospiraceae bacterium]|nr:response regulator [Lachnospiraceae bacterium]